MSDKYLRDKLVRTTLEKREDEMSDELFKERDCDRYGSMPNISSEIAGAGLTGCYQERCLSLATANRLHREWLAKGVTVYGRRCQNSWYETIEQVATSRSGPDHTAILVNISEIEPEDSERKVLEDIIADYEKHLGSGMLGGIGQAHFVERARRLLSKRSEK